jgi:hypothetical protein
MIVSVKKFQQYTNVFVDDLQLQEAYLQSAQNVVEDYLGYGLRRKIHTLVSDGNGSFELQLRARPVNEILSVNINGIEMNLNGFYSENEFIHSKDEAFPIGRRNVIVKYDAGYYEVRRGQGSGCHCVVDENGNKIIDGGDAELRVADPDTDVDTDTDIDDDELVTNAPPIIVATILRIAAILQTESDGNIAVTSKSFADSGMRTFLNTTDFSKYLIQLSQYRLMRI